jgi:hypothetical protein
MFPGVKTPGYSQDVPGQKQRGGRFSIVEGIQSIRNAFEG